MRFFNIFALAGAATLPFVSGAPVVDAKAVGAGNAGVHARNTHVSTAVRSVPRAITGVASILADLHVNLGETLCDLQHFTADNATKENITPVLQAAVSVIASSVVDFKALNGKPNEVIMASLDGSGTISVSDVAQLLADVLCAIFLALSSVLSVITNTKVLVDVIVSVSLSASLCDLISAVSVLVSGVIAETVPHVSDLSSLLTSLGLTAVGKLLTIL